MSDRSPAMHVRALAYQEIAVEAVAEPEPRVTCGGAIDPHAQVEVPHARVQQRPRTAAALAGGPCHRFSCDHPAERSRQSEPRREAGTIGRGPACRIERTGACTGVVGAG